MFRMGAELYGGEPMYFNGEPIEQVEKERLIGHIRFLREYIADSNELVAKEREEHAKELERAGAIKVYLLLVMLILGIIIGATLIHF